ncbi:MAG: DUF1957 domain-containing protein [Spirochaetaceae bacterium]|jgi:1,4-alpha-glucan branching enzyme|nr:DUF1957 domain-containing protein [Spirochaetaceae bacterium]
MDEKNVVSFVLNANLSFVRESGPRFSFQEMPLFEMLEATLLPLLEMFDRLEAESIPFRIGLVLSPTLCHLLSDEKTIERYLSYVDARIEFGHFEQSRLKNNSAAEELARRYCETAIDRRHLFTERYEKNILKAILWYCQHGRLEFINTAATNAFLPFYSNMPQVIQAQIESALQSSRGAFPSGSDGFYLPELGWCESLDKILRAYKFNWTLIDTHTALFAAPPPVFGSFYPMISPGGLTLLARDFFAYDEVMNQSGMFPRNPLYRSYYDDSGYDLCAEAVAPFISANGIRTATGYKYMAAGEGCCKKLYLPEEAAAAARGAAIAFLKRRAAALSRAKSALGGRPPVSVCAFNADFFGRFWHEGIVFLEEVFRRGPECGLQFMTPSEYLSTLNVADFQKVMPGLSSQGFNGYSESYLGSSNDWVYRHLLRSSERMTELADMFSDNGNEVRRRALAQATREILLAQSSDWLRIISSEERNISREWSLYARERLETHLRNFTTFYETIGSTYVSTRLLTELEQTNNIFPAINYRVFRKKI